MTYIILYDEIVVKKDIPQIATKNAKEIRKAIEKKLAESPELYGVPLRTSLWGFRKLRVGDYRIIFEISHKQVTILIISHRKNVYNLAKKRLEK